MQNYGVVQWRYSPITNSENQNGAETSAEVVYGENTQWGPTCYEASYHGYRTLLRRWRWVVAGTLIFIQITRKQQLMWLPCGFVHAKKKTKVDLPLVQWNIIWTDYNILCCVKFVLSFSVYTLWRILPGQEVGACVIFAFESELNMNSI